MSSEPLTATIEQSLYVSFILGSMLYGAYYVCFFLSLHFLRSNPNLTPSTRRFYSIFSSILVAFNTLNIATMCYDGQMMWIVHRNDLGGPMEYYYTSASTGWLIAGDTTQAAANLLADLLLIYRCYVIYDSQVWITIFPLLCTLAFTGTFIVTQYMASTQTFPSANAGLILEVANYATTVGMNLIVTVLICARLLTLHHRFKQIADRRVSGIYTGFSAIMIESAAPFCVFGILTCVLDFTEANIAPVFTMLWYCACAISPQLIILRVAMGSAWRKDTLAELLSSSKPMTTMEFSSRHAQRQGRRHGAVTISTTGMGDTSKDGDTHTTVDDDKIADTQLSDVRFAYTVNNSMAEV